MIGLFLFFLSIILLIVIEVINFVFYILCKKESKGYWLSAAKDVDKFGNRHFRFLFNKVLIKKEGHQFGNIDETISKVLGHNILSNTLTLTGKIIVFILTKKHCLNSLK